ncbi:hypothetical protein [Neoroseomonas rubea]|uniref:hypothetical protein n=1 Tax=Neoroseomonas rubea TaxID=2748666 RepID=UPI0018E03654|nr:hypothetical protein [Roseomonas rubea]
MVALATGMVIAPLLPAPALACLPSGVTVLRRRPVAAQQAQRAPAATVLLDVSGSMAGYVAAPSSGNTRPTQQRSPQRQQQTQPAQPLPEPRTFRELVLSLPQIASQVSDRVSAFGFGRTIRALSLSELQRATRPEFYRDTESRIGEALSRMEALPGEEIGILATDLFLTGEEVFGGASAIRAPLSRILADGRSVGLMGIRSGFSGTIFDIPVVRTYDGAAERPFYVIVTGPHSAVARLIRRIEVELLSPLPPTADGSPRSHATIYTKTPITGGPLALDLRPTAPAVVASSLSPEMGSDVRQVSFPRGEGTAAATLPLTELAQGPVLSPDEFQIEEMIWAETSPRNACGERWLPFRSAPGQLAAITTSTGSSVISVGGRGVLSRMLPGVPFVLQIKVSAIGLSDAPAATAWTRAWNLEARDAERFTLERPRLFKTLNLREVATMLEAIVREDFQPQPVGEAVLAFQVPR